MKNNNYIIFYEKYLLRIAAIAIAAILLRWIYVFNFTDYRNHHKYNIIILIILLLIFLYQILNAKYIAIIIFSILQCIAISIIAYIILGLASTNIVLILAMLVNIFYFTMTIIYLIKIKQLYK